MTESTSRRGWVGLALLLLVALLAHLALLGTRWINPDEGAHLMDGLLLLDGLVPGVDFGARQPFYVLATAAVLDIFGTGFVQGRVLALLCTLGSAVLVFALARDLFDETVALLSAALFLFMPFTLVMSVNAKTEPLAMLLAAGAMWLSLLGLTRTRRTLHLGAAGALCALGFYVRESSLAIPAALVLVLAVHLRRDLRRMAAGLASIAGGFLIIGLVTGAIYARHSSLEAAWRDRSINPVVFVLDNVSQLTGAVSTRLTGPEPIQNLPPAPRRQAAPAQESSDDSGSVGADQSFEVTMRNVVETAELNAVVFLGALLYPVVLLLTGAGRPREELDDGRFAGLILLSWTGVLAAAYLFWAVRRGFFQAYFLELLPPLLILTSAVTVACARPFMREGHAVRAWAGLAVVVATLLAIPWSLGNLPLSRPLYFFVPTGVLAVVHLYDHAESRRWAAALSGVAVLSSVGYLLGPTLPGIPSLGLYAALAAGVFATVFWAARISWTGGPATAGTFACYAVTVSAFFLTLGESIPRVQLEYDAVWAPETVRVVADEIRTVSAPGSEVLSGAVIWELQADRRPFMNRSHPLGLRLNYAGEVGTDIRERLAQNPPAVVVFDGYTEQTYGAAVPELRDVIERGYTRTLSLSADSRHPVEVYRLNE